MQLMKEVFMACARCKKNNVSLQKTRTTINFGNYEHVDLKKIFGNQVLCEDCSKKLKKWMDEK